jgi:hypothetical protein
MALKLPVAENGFKSKISTFLAHPVCMYSNASKFHINRKPSRCRYVCTVMLQNKNVNVGFGKNEFNRT